MYVCMYVTYRYPNCIRFRIRCRMRYVSCTELNKAIPLTNA